MLRNRPTGLEGAFELGRQKMQETEEEKAFRQKQGFKDIEANLPTLKMGRRGSFLDNITSYLGKSNPFTHPVDPNEHAVWLFDNTAYKETADGPWKLEVVSSFFVKHSGKEESAAIASLAATLGLAEDEAAKKEIAKRLRPLLDTVLPSHTVKIEMHTADGVDDVHKLGPSDRDGISNDILSIRGSFKDGQTITSHAIGIKTATPLTTTFAAPSGWAVVSDIDDTIKRTMTSSPLGILQTTFVDEPTPIKGMPELYKEIVTALDNPPFWYLSASPYNLYPFLREFRDLHYPPGQLILREASWMNLAGFLASLTQGTQAYKVDRMKWIQSNWPNRRVVCIGDSTQSDPEAYGEIYRTFPKWVGAIFIRKVEDVEPMNENEKNKPERFEKAFKDVPRDVWKVFTEPSELVERVRELGQEAV